MSYKVSSVEGQPSPWTLHTRRIEDGGGVEVRLSSEDEATHELHVHQARILAERVLRYLGVNNDMYESAGLIISEFGANAIEHGEGLRDLYLVWDAPQQTLDITVINPTDIEAETPGTDRLGGLAAEEDNAHAEHGRGMWIAYALTNGHVDQHNERDVRSHPIMRTHATLGKFDTAA